MIKLKLVPDIQSEVDRLEAHFKGEIQEKFPEIVLKGLLASKDPLVKRHAFVVKDEHGRCLVYYDAAIFALTDKGVEMSHVALNEYKVFHNASDIAEYV